MYQLNEKNKVTKCQWLASSIVFSCNLLCTAIHTRCRFLFLMQVILQILSVLYWLVLDFSQILGRLVPFNSQGLSLT